MTCPRCQAENREGRRFCAKCAAPLATACPSCGFSNEPGENFCGGCAAPLTVASRPAEARFASPHSYMPKHLAEKILTSKSALGQATLEQAFDMRLELRPVLTQLGDVPSLLERLREAEALAERLSDDRRRGRVCAFMTAAHTHFGEPALALATGIKALHIAKHLGDLRLRIVTTSFLVHAHYLRGEYERAIALATDNLAVLTADWVPTRSCVESSDDASLVAGSH
jgi:hypothetical protein